uniref:Myosin heavy chain-like n=1 Tax=Oryza barthii TaxID=65489 RepID=A0A679BC71_9ORYZ|nr:myosin heavy chain-like [Oryza barthii]
MASHRRIFSIFLARSAFVTSAHPPPPQHVDFRLSRQQKWRIEVQKRMGADLGSSPPPAPALSSAFPFAAPEHTAAVAAKAAVAVTGGEARREEERRRVDKKSNMAANAAEAELSSARIELESIKAEGLRFTTSIERTRRETARVTDEIRRLTEQEKAASAQVKQLNAKLLKARSRLEAVTAADERADETISKLAAILRQLEDDAEAAEKEKTLTETGNRRAMSDAENIDVEIAAAEQRIRESMRELGAASASEAAATARLKAIVVVQERHDPRIGHCPRFFLSGQVAGHPNTIRRRASIADGMVLYIRLQVRLRHGRHRRRVGEAETGEGG